ncbi:sodium-translocating pyrophosphatase [Roseiflexus castenholzii]|uniref:K(+)-insensitive pyrophosphate-energized proton pump n=1 Tax=Roseiflexus castenholzii (strain DSM 13941 / HLO8) TaxID=383372 RepID=A7NPW2_ROSCS|nr:sodium-translocating pyrophosphatase [Roseiflexus castenholzii]ABU59608.1 V-type H(+)-translocating pyrophosphatase [Roseiflexus castenholzii DSM 13941]
MQELSAFEQAAVWAVLGVAIFGIAYAFVLRAQILAQDKGTARMQEVWGFIKDGANAYLSRQFRTIAILIVVLTFLLAASVFIIPPTREAVEHFGSEEAATLWVALGRAVAFLMGSLFSYAVGFVGMNVAVEGNVRVAAASRKGYNPALQVAYKSGSVTGMLTVGLGLLGGTLIFMVFGIAAPDALLGFGFGGSLIALFMRVGGGIYTKAADVGADLVGKVEAGIPEDDPRNAAVIADLVGDNVGDCAGMAADVFESFEVTLVSALILGLVLGDAVVGTLGDGQYDLRFIVFPLVLRAIGVIASVIGNSIVSTDEKRRNAMAAMNRGFYVAALVCFIGFAGFTAVYMVDPTTGAIDWRPFLATIAGLVLAVALDKLTEYFTSTHFNPVKETSKASKTGAATNILSGLALGMESSVWAILVICASILTSIAIYSGYSTDPTVTLTAVLYGVSLTGIGMLTLTGNTISMDSFGPISDNANGIGEMAGLDKNARNVMDDLDAVGNTTKAVTKGIAIGSAVIAAVALYGSYLADVSKVQEQIGVPLAEQLRTIGINVAMPTVFIGLLIGGAVPFLFSSLTIRAVQRAASQIVNEVRRQFKIPGVMEGTVTPDYAQAVSISTVAAQKELISLGLIAVMVPILVGFLLGVEALGGFLAGIILSGQLMAVFQANAGGAWDNAKKYIEEGNFGGKHSEPHKAAVVGDTVGDPLKDTAGPALNPMIKVINLVALIIAPIVVTIPSGSPGVIFAMVLCAAALVWAIWQSKREAPSMTTETPAPATTAKGV